MELNITPDLQSARQILYIQKGMNYWTLRTHASQRALPLALQSVHCHPSSTVNEHVKQSLYRPLGLQEAPRVSTQLAHESGKVVSPTHQLPASPLPPEISPVLTTVRVWADTRAILQPEGLSQWNVPISPSRIKPVTFKLSVQCLNHLCHCIPQQTCGCYI
jgi:hypothetical protein